LRENRKCGKTQGNTKPLQYGAKRQYKDPTNSMKNFKKICGKNTSSPAQCKSTTQL